jgi:hypothetical protein
LRIDEAGGNFRAADIYPKRELVSLTFGCLLLCAHLMFICGQPEMAVPQENRPSL